MHYMILLPCIQSPAVPQDISYSTYAKVVCYLQPHLVPCAQQFILSFFVPRTRIALAQHRAFVAMGPSTCNDLPPSLRAKLITDFSPSTSHSLKNISFPGFLCRERI